MKNKEQKKNIGNIEAEFDRILQAKFQELLPEVQIPENLQKEVFNTLDSIEFIAEVIDLFTIKFPLVNLKYLDDPKQNIKANDKKK